MERHEAIRVFQLLLDSTEVFVEEIPVAEPPQPVKPTLRVVDPQLFD